ncbi:MAG TPA: hypothetical protein VFB96_01820 [Pirellulaceae bacterium]|nr:hypothetical protein [Pirellulaceae bacterium]
MDSEQAACVNSAGRHALTRSLLILAGVLALAWPAFAAYGGWRAGWSGLLVASATAMVCGLAAGVSLILTVTAQRTGQPVTGILLGMIVRMAVPFVALLAVPQFGDRMRGMGVQEMLLGYYLVALTVETWLLVQLVSVSKSSVTKAA